METLRRRAASGLIGVATAVAILALVIPLFLNPVWVAFEQDRSQAAAWTGFDEPQLRAATDAILADLVFGPAAFDVEVAGVPVLNEREQAHMRDVRSVFFGFFAVAVVLVVAAAFVIMGRRRGEAGGAGAASWGAIRNGAIGLIAGLALVGAVALVAFDVLFEVFHQLFFAGGSYTFDPGTERLVQLFPFQFWQETSVAVGVVAAVVAACVAGFAHRRATGARVDAAAPARATA